MKFSIKSLHNGTTGLQTLLQFTPSHAAAALTLFSTFLHLFYSCFQW